MFVKRGKHGELLAPVKGDMERTIHESIDAKISIKLTDNLGSFLFEGFAPIAGLEIVGDVSGLQPVRK